MPIIFSDKMFKFIDDDIKNYLRDFQFNKIRYCTYDVMISNKFDHDAFYSKDSCLINRKCYAESLNDCTFEAFKLFRYDGEILQTRNKDHIAFVKYFKQGFIQYKKQNFRRAIICFKSAMSIKPDDNVSEYFINKSASKLEGIYQHAFDKYL
jgi:hypothetical protein